VWENSETFIYSWCILGLVKKTMRYIVREIGKPNPLFDKDIGDKGILITRKVRNQIAYISNKTDDGNAVVINVISAKDLYVDNDGDAFMCLTSTF